LLYVVDLYARDGERPLSLEGAAARKNDLTFGKSDLYSTELSCRGEGSAKAS